MTVPIQEKINHIPVVDSVAAYLTVAKVTFFTPMGTTFSSIKGQQQWGSPRCMVGPPGVGKTSVERLFMRSLFQRPGPTTDGSVPLECFEPGAIGEAGVGVVPMPKEQFGEDVMVFPPHAMFVALGQANRAAGVFVDEMSTARGTVQDALLTLVQQGKIGTYYMPPRVRRNAAMNPEDIVTGDAITHAQANRFLWFTFIGPTMDERANFRAALGSPEVEPLDVDAIEADVIKNFPKFYAQTSAEIMGWLRARPQFCNAQPAAGDPAGSGPWPSDRSTDTMGRVLAVARYFGLSKEFQSMFTAASIGRPAAIDFEAWCLAEDIPDIEAFLDGKLEFEHNISRLDRTMAVVQGCRTALVNQSNIERQRMWALRLAKFAKNVQETASDAVSPLIGDLRDLHQHKKRELLTPEWAEILVKSGQQARAD